ncbi:GRF1-interacting factor 2-like [Phragmites australis]|uniref:GRF1-interacting factor 2-like n=1 Tax=Phragmites australis TaxID=29695 RepID=UPI002D79324C|nr:GRF1-interacting factor 2-like [Phragmites australis]
MAMQQQMPMPPGGTAAAAPPAAGITTEQIQKYLDENKQLILAILENQNLGKLAECAQYQAQLQNNLLYLAAIADAQPQPPQNPASRPQMMQPGIVPGAGHYMSQVPMFPPRTPLTPQQMQEQQQQQLHQQQAKALPFPGQMVMRPANVNGMQPMQAAALQQSTPVPTDGRGGKQDAAAGVSSEPSGTESHKGATGADKEAGGDVAEKS